MDIVEPFNSQRENDMVRTGSIKSHDGTAIFYYEAFVPNAIQTVVLVHGFAEHAGRYCHVTEALNQASISVLAIDLRGHGQSGGEQGHMDSIDQYVEDVHAGVKFAKQQTGAAKVILMAHSMGGLVASHYAMAHPKELAGLILSSPLMGIKVAIPAWKKIVGELMATFHPLFRLKSTINADDLTHDKAMADIYRNDSRIFHFVRARFFSQLQMAIEEAQGFAPKIQIPLLMQLSDPDHIVDGEKSRRWFEKCQMADRKEIVYGGFFHEIYNELDRNRPIRDATEWITQL
jgi:lysophospholipase